MMSHPHSGVVKISLQDMVFVSRSITMMCLICTLVYLTQEYAVLLLVKRQTL